MTNRARTVPSAATRASRELEPFGGLCGVGVGELVEEGVEGHAELRIYTSALRTGP